MFISLKASPQTQESEVQNRGKKFDFNLEALRGYAALFVALGHAILFHKLLDPKIETSIFNNILVPGHFCVLIFFVLSGYVIGISNKERLAGRSLLIYLKKRFIRLYPIYFISIIFALIVVPGKDELFRIISNLTFTQVLFSETISGNGPLWSIHYEFLFYLLFIPVSFFQVNPIKIAILSLIIALLNFFLFPIINTPILTSYSIGFIFWTCGLIIARSMPDSKLETNYPLLLSNIALILSLHVFNVITTGINKLFLLIFNSPLKLPDDVYEFQRIITFDDLSYLPYCILFILTFTGKISKTAIKLLIILQLLPGLTFVYMLKNYNSQNLAPYIIPGIFYIVSLILFFIKIEAFDRMSGRFVSFGIWLGSISYGIYIINFPMLYFFHNIDFFSGSMVTLSVRILLYIAAVICLSYVLEKKVQTWIVSKKLV